MIQRMMAMQLRFIERAKPNHVTHPVCPIPTQGTTFPLTAYPH
jgi:hypothetical protein